MTQQERHPRWTTPLALALAALALAAAAATVALAIANRATLPNLDAADPISIVVPIGVSVVGALIASRHPRNPTGWLFLFAAAVGGLQGVEDQYARFALVTHGGGLPWGAFSLWLNSWSLSLIYPCGAVAMFFLLLPDGHLPSRRWRAVVALAVVVSTAAVLLTALAPGPLVPSTNGLNYQTPVNPVGLAGFSGAVVGALNSALYIAGLVLLLASASAPLVRSRRSHGELRQQLKWIAYAVIITVVVNLTLAIFFNQLPGWVYDLPIVVGFGVAMPVAAAIAIFKYRLYDIDVVISRTIVYGSLAVFITAVYVGIAVGIGALVGSGGKPNLGLSILATAIVAVGFQPVRERVQRIANRLVYGKRATPYEVLAQFSERVAESYAADDVMPRMARVLAEGTGAQRADVWLRGGTQWRNAAVWPSDASPERPLAVENDMLPALGSAMRVVEVRYQGDLLGALGVTKRSGESLTPVEENLLSHLAGQAGLVLKNVGLTSDLQARLEELRASRQRLVTAQDEERRRLERNLHDGAQQHLVALKVKLGLAELLMSRDPAKARATIEQLKGDADEALETLRDLARGIYPPLLAEKGLGAALGSQARKATIPVTIDAEGVGRYSQDIEAAVYFSVLEALQNVQKYAQASKATVLLREADGVLRFEVADDGQGFDVLTRAKGSGLTNVADRVDALGGAIDVHSVLGRGTTLAGTLSVPVRVAVPA
ncbi:MAG: sensor histidine kinase [Candidatus Dormibacteraeota bacterium]|uniref:histidine kinase n=1 Tax=Candidatus Aeolococcus gillhamiae TaxID=3127015 RepID=A0A934JPX1_9BACT|nr:sensor histidine kinase [Candidatus Dormibacteraeota bacterium]